MVVAVLTTNNPRPIELHVKRAREKLSRKARPDEMKATHLQRRVIEGLLKRIADEDVEIISVIVDKRAIQRPPEDPEEIYRAAVTQAVAECVRRWRRIELVLDKRYTKAALRYKLERAMREGIVNLSQELVLIRQEDSRASLGLQAVDHMVWAIFQKYEARDERFYAILKDRIVVEEVVARALW